MIIKTGQTVYELVRSFNPNTNNPIVPTTFMSKIYTNGVVSTGVTINVVLSDIDEGIYTISWSASTFGTYQAYIENIETNVVYVSEIYNVKPDNEVDNNAVVYVGL
jgi:tellurite resistance protein TehA-like permease